MRTMAKICGKFLAIYSDSGSIRKVSGDLVDCGRYAEGLCLSALLGTIFGNHLSKKIVMPRSPNLKEIHCRSGFTNRFVGL